MDEPKITYQPGPAPTASQVWNGKHRLVGVYRVEYSDGAYVGIPHVGWTGTISEEPLDPSIPEHRDIILGEANAAHQELLRVEKGRREQPT